jgi:hypothetical protein
MPLTDLLQWIEQARKTGTILVHGDRYTKKILVRDGRIIASASDDPTDHLGHFLLRQNRITEPQLKKALETQQKTGVMLGKILVTVGLIEEPELYSLLIQKAEETIFGLFLWNDARFEFTEGETPAKIAVPLSLRIEDVLLKGLTWYDEMRNIRETFPTSRSVLRRAGTPLLPADGISPGTLAHRVLSMADGRRSIADICFQVHASEFSVSKLLYLFLKRRYVEIVAEAPAPAVTRRGTFSELLDEARAHLRAGKSEEALRTLEDARRISPTDIALRELTDAAQAAFVDNARLTGLSRERVPVLVKPLESLTGEQLTPQEVFILTRVNGSWNLAAIISLCPFQEAEALMHLKRLSDRGILRLADPE